MKKALSLFLALMLCVSLAIPALAADTEEASEDATKLDITADIAPYGYKKNYQEFLITLTNVTKSDSAKVAYRDGYVYYVTKNAVLDIDISKEDFEVNISGAKQSSDGYTASGESTTLTAYYNISHVSYTFDKVGMWEVDIWRGMSGPFTKSIVVIVEEDGGAEEQTAAEPTIVLSPQNVTLDGKAVNTEVYNIDDSNYFKLRDLAAMLNGTGSQFEVGYDKATNTISITTGAAYTPVGGEMSPGADKSSTCVTSPQKLLINGTEASLTAYNIGGNNFFKLRDLGTVLGFGVDYNSATNTAVITSK